MNDGESMSEPYVEALKCCFNGIAVGFAPVMLDGEHGIAWQSARPGAHAHALRNSLADRAKYAIVLCAHARKGARLNGFTVGG